MLHIIVGNFARISWNPKDRGMHVHQTEDDLPTYGPLPRADVALAIIQAEVGLQITNAIAGQPVDAQVARIADTLSFPTPAIH